MSFSASGRYRAEQAMARGGGTEISLRKPLSTARMAGAEEALRRCSPPRTADRRAQSAPNDGPAAQSVSNTRTGGPSPPEQ